MKDKNKRNWTSFPDKQDIYVYFERKTLLECIADQGNVRDRGYQKVQQIMCMQHPA